MIPVGQTTTRNELGPLRLVTGSGRSGTTWLAEVLCRQHELRLVFEGLHPCCRRGELIPPAFSMLTREMQDFAAGCYFDALFSGEIDNIWLRYQIVPARLNPLSRLDLKGIKDTKARWVALWTRWRAASRSKDHPPLFKFIRANMLLDWLVARYPCRVVHLVRSPHEVLCSRLRLGGADWDARTYLDAVVTRLPDTVRLGFEGLLADLRNEAEATLAAWIIENRVALDAARKNPEILVVDYADLRQHPDEVLQKVTAHLQLTMKSMDAADISRPSTQHRVLNRKPQDDPLGNAEGARLADMLKTYGFSEYSDTFNRTADETSRVWAN